MNIGIILGSSREGRRGEKVANWVTQIALKRKDMKMELLDLKEWDLPIFNEPTPLGKLRGNFEDPKLQEWVQKISSFDGYVIVSPEYNHGYPAVLKNALDYVYDEMEKKPVGIVSYSIGPFGGVRMVEQLKMVILELDAIPLNQGLVFPKVGDAFDDNGEVIDELYIEKADEFFENLLWWTSTLKNGRESVD